MQILSRLIDFFPNTSRAHRGRRPAPRRRSPMAALETLEDRSLMSVAGVNVLYGNLQIRAPQASGNVAVVAIDPSNHDVKVTLNGQSEEFAASSIYNITYTGGSGGGDSFTDDTSLTTLAYLYGNGNDVTGGTGYNYFYFYGSGNTYNAQADLFSDVFEDGGDDTVNQSAVDGLQVYNSSGKLLESVS